MTVAINHTTPSDGSFSATGAVAWDAAHAISGTVPIANGGTNGTAAPTAGAVPYGDGTSYNFTAAGTLGQVLTSAGAGVPTWATPASGGSPGGSTTQIQYNNAGAFAGSAALTLVGSTLTTSADASINTLTVGLGGGQVASNVAIGYQALLSNTTSTLQTAVGYQALKNTTGGNNTGVGYQALLNNVAGNGNTAVGRSALQNGTSDQNTAVGYAALNSNTGIGSTAVGYSSFSSATTGGNTGLGNQTGQAVTTATGNTLIGNAAGYTNITGNYMTAVGNNAARNATGTSITAIGVYAAYSSTGTDIVGVGIGALQSNTSGSYNVAVGNSALITNTTSNANTAVGYQALNLSTGTTNAAFGYSSGSAITSGTYNVVIGGYTGSAAPISATGSNYIVLSDGQANVRAYWNGAAATFNGGLTVPQVINGANVVTVTTNAGTVPIAYRINNFTNSSAATMTITMATASAVDGQMSIVRVYDFSAATQTITWVNTENSDVTVPTPSNGSTTLPRTVGFMYNSQTSKWRCIAFA